MLVPQPGHSIKPRACPPGCPYFSTPPRLEPQFSILPQLCHLTLGHQLSMGRHGG